MTWKHSVDHTTAHVQVSFASMSVHLGTHVDAPLHFIKGGKTTAQIDLEKYCGQAICIDVPDVSADKELDFSESLEKNKDLIRPGDIIVFHTGWEDKVGTEEYFKYPMIHLGTGELLSKLGAKGIGMDMPSLDLGGGENHREILGRDLSVIESLINLKPLIGRRFYISAVPLKFEDGDGSPVRAYAVTDD